MLIAHASDLTGDDTSAFVHASALAAASASRLVTVHGNAPALGAPPPPDAAELATRWGCAIDHERRYHECCDDVADTVLDALRILRPELVVLGTHGRHGLTALVRGSISESITRNLTVPALVIPNGGRGFVNVATGAIDLRRILIPAGTADDARRGLTAARRLLALAGGSETMLELVHVGTRDPALEELGVTVTRVDGSLEDAILEVARTHDTCVIVMPTAGHDGFGDVLLGSHTERVIREATCPVLSVPI
jgi:nucleotide-binding universal stress UspA family protein